MVISLNFSLRLCICTCNCPLDISAWILDFPCPNPNSWSPQPPSNLPFLQHSPSQLMTIYFLHPSTSILPVAEAKTWDSFLALLLLFCPISTFSYLFYWKVCGLSLATPLLHPCELQLLVTLNCNLNCKPVCPPGLRTGLASVVLSSAFFHHEWYMGSPLANSKLLFCPVFLLYWHTVCSSHW